MKSTVSFLILAIVVTARADDHWKVIASPTSRNLYRVCFIDSLQGWVVGDTGTMLRTTDGGTTWTNLDPGVIDDIQDLFVLDSRHFWAIAMRYDIDSLWFGTVLLRTSDGGSSWTKQLHRDEYFSTVTFLDSANGWMGGSAGELLRTSDGGRTWEPAAVDSSMWMTYPILRFAFFSRTYGFGLGGQIDQAGVLWRTTNGGDRWTVHQAAGEPVRGLHYIDSLHILAIGGDFENGPATVWSTDGGETWREIYLNLVGEVRAMSFRTSAEAWVVLGILGEYMVTRDTGSTWTTFTVPDSGAMLDVTFSDSLHGYMVGTRGMMMKFKPGSTGDVRRQGGEPPPSFALEQNFPNPFNPSTTIRYAVPVRSRVRMEVFSVLGQQVAVIVDGIRDAGSYEAVWTPALPSGVYFCRLVTQDLAAPARRFLQVTRMELLR